MELHTNSSNNTIFADADGNIAYFHSNFIPRRDTRFDWTKPVDGSDPATDWHGVLSFDETPNLINPPNGWLYNSNNWPWSAAGPNSPKRSDYPPYVERGREETPRGFHALRVLPGQEGLHAGLADRRGVRQLSACIRRAAAAAAEGTTTRLPAPNPLKSKLAEQIEMLAQVGSPLVQRTRSRRRSPFSGPRMLGRRVAGGARVTG